MLLEILKHFNWIDFFIVFLLFRTCYIAIKRGLPVEFFKLLGVMTAIYLSLHYYTGLSDWMLARLPHLKERMPLEFSDFLCFMFLALFAYFVFAVLRVTFYRFIKMEAVPRLNMWGGFFVGIGRGVLVVALIMFMLVISSITYFRNSVKNSYYGRQFFQIAPAFYTSLWNGFGSKIMAKEKYNKTIQEIQDNLKSEK